MVVFVPFLNEPEGNLKYTRTTTVLVNGDLGGACDESLKEEMRKCTDAAW
jgi:hypothetical protein